MSCQPCTVPTFCNPPNFAVLFPDLVGPTGPTGSSNVPDALAAAGAVPLVFLPSTLNLPGLAAIPSVAIPVPYMVGFLNAGTQQLWLLSAGTTPTGPGVQRPNDYAGGTNEKVWTQVA